MTPNLNNILAEYARASVGQSTHYLSGMTWYTAAHSHAADMGNVTTAAGVIAALSPNTPWDRNLKIAREAMATGQAGGTLGASVAKANLIMAGADPLDVLGGFKVRSFFQNIADPSDAHTVTIDRHAYDIAVGIRNGKDARPLGSLKAYEAIADLYREAGEILRVLPWQVQAVTWESWRSRLTTRRGSKS